MPIATTAATVQVYVAKRLPSQFMRIKRDFVGLDFRWRRRSMLTYLTCIRFIYFALSVLVVAIVVVFSCCIEIVFLALE